ncbi:GNAT family N-acetyltransferase [Niveibacterium sp. SC-1]|uniref:GNAT family N-acetyltransferase n=1 Tax=Niveibacterium sp. SC-1 TaxID=3135646 RepID=UPI00311DBB12
MAEPAGWRIVAPGSADDVDKAGLRLVATGRGSLRRIVGESEERYRLFARRIRWDRVLLIVNEAGVSGGFVSFKSFGRGPYAPGLGDFLSAFGARTGWWRFIAFWLIEGRDLGRGFYVYGLKVAVSQRRQGLAAMLLAAAESEAWRRGAAHVSLEVAETNSAAKALYTSQGYLPVSTFRLRFLLKYMGIADLLLLRKPRPA